MDVKGATNKGMKNNCRQVLPSFLKFQNLDKLTKYVAQKETKSNKGLVAIVVYGFQSLNYGYDGTCQAL